MSILLLDTYSLFFRAFHALPPMNTRAGRPTNALYGFSSLLLKLWRTERPSGIAFAVDAPSRTFRHEAFAEYKAGRARTPDSLQSQLGALAELLGATGAPVFCVPGFEADDLLATLATELDAGADPPLVVSGDRDLLQLATGSTHVLFTGRRGKDSVRYDAAAVEARFGVPPALLPAYVALVGDNSDNLAGVAGIGPRTAAELVRRYGTIDALFAHRAELAASVAEKLAGNEERIRQNERLVTLRRDVALPEGPRHATLGAHARARLAALFETLEFKSLLARLEALGES